jgi:hypothetical protein
VPGKSRYRTYANRRFQVSGYGVYQPHDQITAETHLEGLPSMFSCC